jgi:hypothetical protein
MAGFQEFDDLFDFNVDYSYDAQTIATIERHRKSLEGLFIDRVLKVLGVKRRKFTPSTPWLAP